MVKTPCFHCRGCEFNRWLGTKISHATRCGKNKYCTICGFGWLTCSLLIIFSKFTQVVAWSCSSFIFCQIIFHCIWVNNICLSIHPLMDRLFLLWGSYCNNSVDIHTQVFVQTCVFISPGYTPASGTRSHKVQFSSVAQSCPTLCNPMGCSTPGFLVYYQLPQLAQTHAHWIGDAIQSSHSLSSPSPPK